ncbi:hypothetical protein WAE58_21635 [Pedobacter panaciterrae]|uniref:Uncharacterized protein n=1 Tax=Pedobacter panaciterrae TaxID=363849 RepID=A0ABU8NS48_9SPHI
MLLDISQNTIIKAPPTVIDSLKYSLSQLQVKVDSLQKVTERAEIGKEFFSDTISTNLYMFATIIGLAALVSWGVIGGMLYLHKRKVEKRAILLISQHTEKYDTSLLKIKSTLLDTNLNATRSMYFAAIQNKANPPLIFDWSMRTFSALIDCRPKSFGEINTWVENTRKALNSLKEGDYLIKKNVTRYVNRLNEVMPILNEEAQASIKLIIEDIRHVAFTKQKTPPENLMNDSSPTESPTES